MGGGLDIIAMGHDGDMYWEGCEAEEVSCWHMGASA